MREALIHVFKFIFCKKINKKSHPKKSQNIQKKLSSTLTRQIVCCWWHQWQLAFTRVQLCHPIVEAEVDEATIKNNSQKLIN
jgi:hypothetical protein